MKNIFTLLVILFGCVACQETAPNQEIPKEKVSGKTNLNAPLPALSIYQLDMTWTSQNKEEMQLKSLRGKVVVMAMIYTSCKTACPRLIADINYIKKQISEPDLENVVFTLVSIDPKTDTPERLKEFTKINHLEGKHWLFLRGKIEDTRTLANTVAVKYKKISPMDFSHSNIITVLDENGVIVHQKEGLSTDYAEIIDAVKQEVNN